MFRKLYYKLFPHYKVLETRFITWEEGDQLLRESTDKTGAEEWVLAKEEDDNHVHGMIYLCRKEKITG